MVLMMVMMRVGMRKGVMMQSDDDGDGDGRCITGLILPSHYDRMLTVSHTFFRLNDINPRAGSARLRWDASERPSSTLRSNRLGRARTVAADMHINMTKVVRSVRHKAVEERPAESGPPSSR